MSEPTGYAVIGAMLGIDVTVLRAISRDWQHDLTTPPMSMLTFMERVQSATAIAEQLNNTNFTELAIREAYDWQEIPPTLPTKGVPRAADEDDK